VKLFLVAGNLDVEGWLLGLWSAAISGGAGAVSSGFGSVLLDPSDFNLKNPDKLVKVMLVTFGFSAFVSLMKYLAMHPAPEMKTVTTTQVTTQGSAAPKVVKTVEETTVHEQEKTV
jgi:hypothetical protein